MPPMTSEELREFLQRPLIVNFTTVRRNGSPHVVPLWYEYDGERFYCWVGGDSLKARNIKRNVHVALCIATHDRPYKYVLAEGTCEIVANAAEVERRAYSISARYFGGNASQEYTRDLLEAGGSVVLMVTPTSLLTESAA